MTQSTAEELVAGPALNWRIHTEVMGQTDVCYRDYSSDIGAAWQVVEHLRTQGFAVMLLWPDHGVIGSAPWTVSLYGTGLPNVESIEADTAPLAICLAALKAIGTT